MMLTSALCWRWWPVKHLVYLLQWWNHSGINDAFRFYLWYKLCQWCDYHYYQACQEGRPCGFWYVSLTLWPINVVLICWMQMKWGQILVGYKYANNGATPSSEIYGNGATPQLQDYIGLNGAKYMPIRIGAIWFIALPWCRITVRYFQSGLIQPSR